MDKMIEVWDFVKVKNRDNGDVLVVVAKGEFIYIAVPISGKMNFGYPVSYADDELELISKGDARDISLGIKGAMRLAQKRLGETRYYLKAQGISGDNKWLNEYTEDGSLSLGNNIEFVEWKTKFTDEEIQELPEWCQAQERVEVVE